MKSRPIISTSLSQEDIENLSLNLELIKSQLVNSLSIKRIEQHWSPDATWKSFEVEFAFDPQGRLWLLQARPLSVSKKPDSYAVDLPPSVNGFRFLEALTVHQGRVKGTLVLLPDSLGPGQKLMFPPNAIIVTSTVKSYWTMQAGFENVVGIITDKGTLLDHSANIAREQGIPALVATQRGAEILTPFEGQEVILDTGKKILYLPNLVEGTGIQEVKANGAANVAGRRDKILTESSA